MTRAIVALCLLLAGAAHADFGLLRVNQVSGPFRISIFTAPTPPRVGVVDISVLVQRAADDKPVLDAKVDLTLRGQSREVVVAATHEAATNKLLYAALINIPVAGRWDLNVRVRANGIGTTDLTAPLEIDPAVAPLWSYWPYLLLPAIAIVLFILNQLLRGASPVSVSAQQAPPP